MEHRFVAGLSHRHRTVSERGVWLLRALVALGVASVAFYFSWWWEADRISSPILAPALALAASYQLSQILGGWILYLFARHRTPPPTPLRPASVDVFVTACGEPADLIRRCLRAAVDMRGAHTTFLLDDGSDPALARLAESLGAGYLTRAGRADAKAGNINAALKRTHGEVVVIFDVDHVPLPEFLERTIGHFSDPDVGFVQAMLDFSNADESWVARAATETSLDFHNPTAMGMDGLESVTLQGSNALIRRAALEEIDGYRPGLAEDLATSIALHAASWRSAFVAEPLAPGLAPVDLPGWFTQQLKWSRGVFEILLTSYPRQLRRLTWGQRLSYAVRSTNHLIGPVIFVHLAVLMAALVTGERIVQASVQQYLLHCAPVGVAFLVIRKAARWQWRHPSTPTRFEWRGMLLLYGTWPIYTLAWFMALLRIPLEFRATPKVSGRLRTSWLTPHVVSAMLLGLGLFYTSQHEPTGQPLVLYSSLFQVALLMGFFGLACGPGQSARASRSHEASAVLALTPRSPNPCDSTDAEMIDAKAQDQLFSAAGPAILPMWIGLENERGSARALEGSRKR